MSRFCPNSVRTSPAVEQNTNIKWSESPWNQSGRTVCELTDHCRTVSTSWLFACLRLKNTLTYLLTYSLVGVWWDRSWRW